MTTEPIRPEDHNLGGNPYGIKNAVAEDGRGRTGAKGLALIEAIHQTFERDAEWSAMMVRHDAALAEWEAFEGYGDVGSFLGGDGKLREPMPRRRPVIDGLFGPRRMSAYWKPGRPPRPADPDTEIDRTARLIVDGEYRRRKGATNV